MTGKQYVMFFQCWASVLFCIGILGHNRRPLGEILSLHSRRSGEQQMGEILHFGCTVPLRLSSMVSEN